MSFPKTQQTSKVLLEDLSTPTFVVNRHTFLRNCKNVASAAKKKGISMLRPHVKTHKTIEGTYIQAFLSTPPPPPHYCNATDYERQESDPELHLEKQHYSSVVGFVASTLPEIQMLIDTIQRYQIFHPFGDILYGVPISEAKLPSIKTLKNALAKQQHLCGKKDDPSGELHVLIDHPFQVKFLESYIERYCNEAEGHKINEWSVFIKVDTGYHRAGITPDHRGIDLAITIINSKYLTLKGIYSHCGQSYNFNESSKLQEIATDDLNQMTAFLDQLDEQLPNDDFLVSSMQISIGSTPSVFHHTMEARGMSSDDREKEGVTKYKVELHPGNYTFYDRQQIWTGACPSEDDVAVRVLARVIGHYEDRNTLLVDAGSTALTKDTSPQGGTCSVANRPDLICSRMSQEVIQIRPVDDSQSFPYHEFPMGCLVALVPNHSCLAAACFSKYHIVDDISSVFSPSEEILDEWIPAKGW